MKTNQPIFPYQNLFITSRPGMGAPELVANIVNQYLQANRKCLIFASVEGCYYTYSDRIRSIREHMEIEKVHPFVTEEGKLVTVNNFFFECEVLLSMAERYCAEVVVYEAPRALRAQKTELIRLAQQFRQRGILFIFVTTLKRRRIPFTQRELLAPRLSRHRKAMVSFDAVAIPYRQGYYGKNDGRDEIRIYEKGERTYRAAFVEFDFTYQRIREK